MKNKKGAIEMEKIVAMALVLIVLVVVIMVFSKLFGKETKATEGQIDKLSADCDCDGTIDMFDKCPYDENDKLNKDGKCEKATKPEKCKC